LPASMSDALLLPARYLTGKLLLLPKRTNRIAANVTCQAKPSMTEFSKLFSPDFLVGQNSGKDHIKNYCLRIHAAGGDSQYGDQFGVRSIVMG